MTIGNVRKALAAFITASLGMAALFGLNVELATPENVAAAAGIIAAIVGAVYQLPNDPA